MSAPELSSPLAHCLEAGRFGADSADALLQIQERKLAVTRLTTNAADIDTLSATIAGDAGLVLPPPGHASTTDKGVVTIWIAPGTWLITEARDCPDDLPTRLARTCGSRASVVDQSYGHVALRLSGPNARDVLAKGCRIDFHPRVFGPGRAAATLIAHVHGIVWQVDGSPTFELIVPSTFAEHVFGWLCLSAAEFGYEVRA